MNITCVVIAITAPNPELILSSVLREQSQFAADSGQIHVTMALKPKKKNDNSKIINNTRKATNFDFDGFIKLI